MNLPHGNNWTGQDLTGWYLSEKFDGVRGYWDGSRMWSRQGLEINLPDWFRAQLPAGLPLDGEIWAGRGNFSRASAAVRNSTIDRDISYVVFDSPTAPGDWMDRMNCYRAQYSPSSDVIISSGFVCRSNKEAVQLMKLIQHHGGEGLIARRPGIGWVPGRSDDILKIKKAIE